MAETIRDVVIRMQIKQVGDDLKPPKIEPFKKQVEAVDKSVVKLNQDTQKLTDTNIQLFDSFGQAGEGVLKMGRGMTLLGISADDDLRKVVEQLAKIQGALDIFTGGVQAVKGMVAAQKALATATAASATATAALATATAVLLSPLVLVGAGITAIVGATLLLTDATEKSIFISAEASQKEIDNLNKRLSATRELIGITKSLSDQLSEFQEPGRREQVLAERRARSAARLARVPGAINAIAGSRLDQAAAGQAVLGIRRGEAAERQTILDIDKERERTRRVEAGRADESRNKAIAAREKQVAVADAAKVIIASLTGRGRFEAAASGRLAELQAPIRELEEARGEGGSLQRLKSLDARRDVEDQARNLIVTRSLERQTDVLIQHQRDLKSLNDEVERLLESQP